MSPIIKTLFAAGLVLSFASCQKVINVDLNDSDSRYIISGEITDAPGPYYVTLSRSKNFDENNDFPMVNGAFAIVKDVTNGTIDTLTEESPGRYRTNTTAGIAGHTYELSMVIGEETFTASTTMPLTAVTIDSLYVRRSDFGTDDYFIVPVFTDPAGRGNNYLLRQYVNGRLIKGSVPRNDEATDGRTVEFPLYYDTEEESGNPVINNGDTVTVALLCIDKPVYEFYRTLEQTTDQNSGTPANPISNIKGGAIGVFNAATIRTRSEIASF